MSKKLIKIDELRIVINDITNDKITMGKACEQISDICRNRALNIDIVSKSLPSNAAIRMQGVKYSDRTNKKHREHVVCAIAYTKGAYWMRNLIKKLGNVCERSV